MDLGLSEEQQMIQTSAREFLAEKSSKEVVRAMEEDDLGYPPELWKEMAGQGWMGMVFPEKYGGDGFSFLDLAVLLEEMGRNLTPSPFFSTVVLCGMPILEFGSDAQKDAHLKKIAGGDEIWVYAQTEPSATWEASGVELTAAKDGDGYTLNGTKLFISYGATADLLLVVARTKEGKGEHGIDGFMKKAIAIDGPEMAALGAKAQGVQPLYRRRRHRRAGGAVSRPLVQHRLHHRPVRRGRTALSQMAHSRLDRARHQPP